MLILTAFKALLIFPATGPGITFERQKVRYRPYLSYHLSFVIVSVGAQNDVTAMGNCFRRLSVAWKGLYSIGWRKGQHELSANLTFVEIHNQLRSFRLKAHII